MLCKKRLFCLCTVLWLSVGVESDTEVEEKSSLSIAIDNTWSMRHDIDVVKRSAVAVVETVANSNLSQIENFVLVSINDPEVRHRITTSDTDQYVKEINKLEATIVDTNTDCPEMAMTGIELAIKESLPGSLLYVFTDASPKDYDKTAAVTRLAQEKSIQVVFARSQSASNCDESRENFKFFEDMSRETGGQMFDIRKREVKNFIDFVIYQIESRKTPLVTKNFPKGTHEFELITDSAVKELSISVSGKNPDVDVTDATNNKAPTRIITASENMAVVEVKEVSAGRYKIRVTSTSDQTVVVSAATSVHFRHGFNTWIPTTIKETATTPLSGEQSYVSIKLITDDTDEFILDEVQIVDLDNNVLIKKPLQLSDEKEQFYVTNTTLVPPSDLFKIMIIGHNKKTNEVISRYSLTPIQAQAIIASGTVTNKKPIVTVIGKDNIIVEYDQPMSLKCKVRGYPKPTVTWQSSSGTVMDSKLSLLEFPSVYISTLTIGNVLNNDTYKCTARNEKGEDNKQIQLQAIRKKYFNVIKKPKDATVEIYKEAQFECKVDAYPAAKIIWIKNKREVESGGDIEMSSDNSVLTIKKMQPYMAANYWCIAYNDENEKIYSVRVKITGAEKPVIDKKVTKLRIPEGSSVEIPCTITHGKPKPTIRWSFKNSKGEDEKKEIYNDQERMLISRVDRTHKGTYTCKATNDLDYDFHRTVLIVEYPPQIKGEASSVILTKEGEKVNMDCDVSGEPKPTVKWFRNGAKLDFSRRYRRKNLSAGFSFNAMLSDTGKYTCEAINDLRKVSKTIDLRVFTPVIIQAPPETKFTKMVGDYLELPCRVYGTPTPDVHWVFHSANPHLKPQKLSFSKGELNKVTLRHIQVPQEGTYVCTATNVGGSTEIAYTLEIKAPPSIANISPKKTFTAVMGDKILTIPCKATGRPTPRIKWFKDGAEEIREDSDSYNIDDGALIIKNVGKQSAGTYTCRAENGIGIAASNYFEVEVEEYPRAAPTKIVNVMQGTFKTISCDILPHKDTAEDDIRWFKDGREISRSSEKYTIINAQFADAGIYTCRRVDIMARYVSKSIKLNVGFPPRWDKLYPLKGEIEFEEGLTAYMDCSAEGNPTPREVVWTHDGKQLAEKTMTLIFDMDYTSIGKYSCVVRNEFGAIQRDFTIAQSEGCLLNIQTDLTGSQPLILTNDMAWKELETKKGFLRIPSTEDIVLSCPSGFRNLLDYEVFASCNKNIFTVNGNDYTYSDLQCKENVKSVEWESSENCLRSNPNSRTVIVGFETRGTFLEVYQICLDKDRNSPIYSRHEIQYSLAGVEPIEALWSKNSLVTYNLDEMFNCGAQVETISSALKRSFHKDEQCCFSRRLLVNPRDVVPGLPQLATYTALNVVPHWSTCNNENWESIETKVRELAGRTNIKLSVWTGTLEKLQISRHDIKIRDRSNGEQAVPKYLWKVIQDPTTQASIAIVQLNIPDLNTWFEASMHEFCRNICRDGGNEIPWLSDLVHQLGDVRKGYTFCCNILDFERASGYREVFNSGAGKLLTDVDLVLGSNTLI